MRLIAAISVLNEEQFIEQCITKLLERVRDLDVIEILDGAWKNGGTDIHSTDHTRNIVESLAHKYHNTVDIVWRDADTMFESESHKRNTHLEMIHEQYGYEPYWVFVIDADETLQMVTGLRHLYLKDYLGNMPFAGCVTAYAVGSRKPMYSPRFFPGGMGFHYHTGRSMIVHTADCKTEFDYNLKSQDKTFGDWTQVQAFLMKDFVLVNYWPARDLARMKLKEQYCQFQEKVEEPQNQPCKYRQRLNRFALED